MAPQRIHRSSTDLPNQVRASRNPYTNGDDLNEKEILLKFSQPTFYKYLQFIIYIFSLLSWMTKLIETIISGISTAEVMVLAKIGSEQDSSAGFWRNASEQAR